MNDVGAAPVCLVEDLDEDLREDVVEDARVKDAGAEGGGGWIGNNIELDLGFNEDVDFARDKENDDVDEEEDGDLVSPVLTFTAATAVTPPSGRLNVQSPTALLPVSAVYAVAGLTFLNFPLFSLSSSCFPWLSAMPITLRLGLDRVTPRLNPVPVPIPNNSSVQSSSSSSEASISAASVCR